MNSKCSIRILCLLFFTIATGKNLVAQKKVEVDFNISVGNSNSIIDFGNNQYVFNGKFGSRYNLNLLVYKPIIYINKLKRDSLSNLSLGLGIANHYQDGYMSTINPPILPGGLALRKGSSSNSTFPTLSLRLTHKLGKVHIFYEFLENLYFAKILYSPMRITLGSQLNFGVIFKNRIKLGIQFDWNSISRSEYKLKNGMNTSVKILLPIYSL